MRITEIVAAGIILTIVLLSQIRMDMALSDHETIDIQGNVSMTCPPGYRIWVKESPLNNEGTEFNRMEAKCIERKMTK